MPQAKVFTHETPRDENLSGPKPVGVPGSIEEHELEVEHGEEHGHIEPFELIRIAVTAILAGMVWFRLWEPFPQVSLIGTAGVLFGGWPVLYFLIASALTGVKKLIEFPSGSRNSKERFPQSMVAAGQSR